MTGQYKGAMLPASVDKVVLGDATLWTGSCLDVLPLLDADSVHCVVTSVPYWGLRDYGIGDTGIGLEPTLGEWLTRLVAVFEQVKRVLRPDGVVFCNVGDAMAGSWGNSGRRPELDSNAGGQREKRTEYFKRGGYDEYRERPPSSYPQNGLKPKDCLLMDYRLAIALQDAGWWVRSKVIWAKPNPMPESVTDRPTKSYETVLMLTKAARYYWDADAVREEPSDTAGVAFIDEMGAKRYRKAWSDNKNRDPETDLASWACKYGSSTHPAGRNLRDVWKADSVSMRLRHDISDADRLYVLAELARRGLLANKSGNSSGSNL